MVLTQVLTHRGLDPSRAPYFPESSREAFEDQLSRGFGLEFDMRPDLLIAHDDPDAIEKGGGHRLELPGMLDLIGRKQKMGLVSALHLKAKSQGKETLDRMLAAFSGFDTSKLILFDILPDTARYLKTQVPELNLAPSVAHRYDIERYNDAVGGTLLSLEEAIENRELFDWVWLDEWDRMDKDGSRKVFYTAETFAQARSAGLRIALVTPELHATSPGLLGEEAHEDAKDHPTLMGRVRQIISLQPDAVCTDYPDEVRDLIGA